MKSGEKPQLSSAWWLKNKAKTLLGTDLDKALAAYDKPYAKFLNNPSGETASLKAAGEALKKLPASVAKTIEKCNATLHKETIECLKKFDPLIKAQLKNITVELNRRAQIEQLTLDALLSGPLKGKFAEFGKKRFCEEMLAYLAVMKMGSKGNAAIFNRFIAIGSELELNIANDVRKQFCKPGDQTQKIPRDDLDAAPWDKVTTIVRNLCQNNLVEQFQTELRNQANSFAGLFA